MSPLPDNNNHNKSTIPSVFDHDCERPACGDMQQMFQQQKQQQLLHPTKIKTTGKNNLENLDKKTTSPVSSDETCNDKSECPVDSRTLGRASWTLLHSMVRGNSCQITIFERLKRSPNRIPIRSSLIYLH
jgi:hypothetical protein